MKLTHSPAGHIFHHPTRPRSPGAVSASVFLVGTLAAFATQTAEIQALWILAAIWLLAPYLSLWTISNMAERRSIALVFLILTISLPVAYLRGATALAHYVVELISVLGAFIFTRDLKTYYLASRGLLLTMLAGVCAYLAVRGVENFPLDEILPYGGSSNGVTAYILLAQINYCIVRYMVCRKSSIITSVLTLLICIVGWGRGSLLAAFVILASNFILLLPYKYRFRSLSLFVVVSYAVNSWVNISDDIINFLEFSTKLGAGFHDQSRSEIITVYLDRIDAITFLTGASYSGTMIDAFPFGGNPHNAYIRAHHIFGLPYLILMLIFPWVLLSRQIFATSMLYPLVMIATLYIRVFTEPNLFPTMLDFFFFAMCFSMKSKFPIVTASVPANELGK